MSIMFNNNRGSGGYGGHRHGGNQPGGASNEQLQELVNNIASLARVLSDETKTHGTYRLTTKLNINGSEYDLKLSSDGTFTATREDGAIEIKLYHDTNTWGSPLEFSYRNDNSPGQSGTTMDGRICDSAQAMARAWFKEATKEDSLDL